MTDEVVPPVDSSPPSSSSSSLASRAVRGGAILMGARFLVQFFLWGVTLVVARYLTALDYGFMTTGLIFIGLADLLAEAGVGRALVQKKDLDPGDIDHTFSLALVLSLGMYVLLFLVAQPVASYYELDHGFPTFLRVLALFVLLVPFRAIPLALLDRDLHLSQQARVHVVSSVLQSTTVLVLAIAGAGYWALAAGTLFGRLLEVIALIHATGWRPRLSLPGKEQISLLRFGVHVTLGNLLWFVYSNSDFAIVGKMVSVEALGYYSLAYQLMALPVQKLTSSINGIVYPVFCRIQDDRKQVSDWYTRLTVLLSFLGAPALAGMALVADDAFPLLLGPRWNDAVLPFQLLAAIGIILVVVASLPQLLNALGRPELPFRYTFVCAIVMPTSFVIGARMNGVVGVCLAWLIVYPVVVGSFFHFTRHVTGVSLGALLRAQAPVLFAVMVMTAAVLAVQHALRTVEPAVVRLVAAVVTGAGVYAGFLLLFARHSVLADLRSLYAELRGRKITVP